MELSEEGRVWNRAALDSGGTNPREGDRALAALLYAHGMVMNGGVGHSLEVLSAEEMREAIAGFRFFSMPEVADFLQGCLEQDPADIPDDADDQYAELVPDDDAIDVRFRAVFSSARHVFSPA
jgi:hypothetical protein